MAGSALLGSHTCIVSHLDLPAGHVVQQQPPLAAPQQQTSVFAPLCKLRKNCSRVSIVCAAKPFLDHRRDTDAAFFSQELHWREEVLSALQRSLLESQWALQSLGEEKRNPNLDKSNPNLSQNSMDAVVKSGHPSARQRRLRARLRANSVSSNSGEVDLGALQFTGPAEMPERKRRRGKAKLEPLHDFVSSFLRPAAGCGMFTKDEEQGFTRQMRIRQSLDKAKRKLEKKLGYEPPYELWAHSVQVSTGELLSMVAEGETARNKMLISHLRLVVSVAKHYQNLGVDMADLIQEGSKGLLRGLERFDHRKGYKISTYVHWWIRQGVTRAIADHSRMMRVPAYLHEIMFAVKRGKAQLIHQGKPVTVENLSLLLNVPSNKIERALQAKNKITSLDKISTSYGLKMEFNGLHEFVPDQNTENQPWDSLYEEHLIGNIRNRMALLTPKEQKIIRWLFGIDTEGGACSSLSSVGDKLGVSKERVRQIKSAAMNKMQLMGGDDSF